MKINSKKQLRIDILSQYVSGKLYYLDAIRALEISERQFRRLVVEFKKEGIRSVMHKNTGKVPPNKFNDARRTKIIRLYKTVYKGMNVTHFMEKLREVEKLEPPSYSTVRKILFSEKLISPTLKRKRKPFPRRQRYEREGLMLQIDGSHHRWIPGLLPCCLSVGIDDATGRILGGTFTKTETTFAAMDVVEEVIQKHGLFQMLYSDRAGIYGDNKREGYSNMNRAMRELGIIPVQAYTPQAKGRVERLFKTLQDRLIHEMRLAGVTTLEQANRFLPSYLEKFNKQFGVPAKCSEAAYRKFSGEVDLDEVFTMIEHRKVQAGEVVSHKSVKYILQYPKTLVGHDADIKFYRDGRMEIHVLGERVDFDYLDEGKKAA
ncbi:MAG: ISNCY family transposase [Brumimicrobium sp.]